MVAGMGEGPPHAFSGAALASPALLDAYYQHYMLDLLLSDTGKAVPKLNLAIRDVAAQLSKASIGALASAATAAGSSHTWQPMHAAALLRQRHHASLQ